MTGPLGRLAPRPVALVLALALIAGAIVLVEAPWAPRSTVPEAPDDIPEEALRHPAAPDFAGATGWVNSPPLDLVALRGQVVLVDFWTYSCINCIHTFPYIRAWHDRYGPDGLVVVGVHTPEFRFERDADNVAAAADRYGLTYPIAQDNGYRVWEAYNNRYWPAKYLVDEWGRIRYSHFGEGAYNETEDMIRSLLEASGAVLDPERAQPQEGGSSIGVRSPEMFVGSGFARARLATSNLEDYVGDGVAVWSRPDPVQRDMIHLVGTWRRTSENATAIGDDASVIVLFRAAGANFVAGGPDGACVGVLLDGAPIDPAEAGADVAQAADGGAPCVALDAFRSYDFYAGEHRWRTVELVVPDGFVLFTFAFSTEAPG